MDRFGEAIEADLADRGIDLLDYFRGRRSWRQLLVLLDHLPRSSHFRQALAEDEEWAEHVLAAEDVGEVGPAPSVPLVEYTREVELLTGIAELLQALNSSVRAVGGDRHPPRVQRMPRPRTAIDRARDRKRAARLDSLVSEAEAAMARWAERHATNDGEGVRP